MTLLWGSHSEPQARQNLRQALARLRRALGEDMPVGSGDTVSLRSGMIDCDIARFEFYWPRVAAQLLAVELTSTEVCY